VGFPLVGKRGLLPDFFLALKTDDFHTLSLASELLTPQQVEAEIEVKVEVKVKG